MYIVKKRIEISASHWLELPYESKCQNLHGHNWIITVEVEALELDKHGMVIDFTKIKQAVMELDHNELNRIISQPTAENIARHIAFQIQKGYPLHKVRIRSVTVQESEGNQACFIP